MLSFLNFFKFFWQKILCLLSTVAFKLWPYRECVKALFCFNIQCSCPSIWLPSSCTMAVADSLRCCWLGYTVWLADYNSRWVQWLRLHQLQWTRLMQGNVMSIWIYKQNQHHTGYTFVHLHVQMSCEQGNHSSGHLKTSYKIRQSGSTYRAKSLSKISAVNTN